MVWIWADCLDMFRYIHLFHACSSTSSYLEKISRTVRLALCSYLCILSWSLVKLSFRCWRCISEPGWLRRGWRGKHWRLFRTSKLCVSWFVLICLVSFFCCLSYYGCTLVCKRPAFPSRFDTIGVIVHWFYLLFCYSFAGFFHFFLCFFFCFSLFLFYLLFLLLLPLPLFCFGCWLFFCSDCSAPCLYLSFLSFLVIILVPAAYCMRQTYCMRLFKIAAFSALFSLALFASDGSEEGPQILLHSQLEWQTLRIHNSHRDRATLSRGLPEAAQLKDFFCGISGRCHESLLLLAAPPAVARYWQGLESPITWNFTVHYPSPSSVFSQAGLLWLRYPWGDRGQNIAVSIISIIRLDLLSTSLFHHTFLLLPLFRLIPLGLKYSVRCSLWTRQEWIHTILCASHRSEVCNYL